MLHIFVLESRSMKGDMQVVLVPAVAQSASVESRRRSIFLPQSMV
ncbi:hypothetical protein EKH55_3515 [Sinorhizobium alkalisoli]|nr:hypothetical protein EKH55_3515 [Sinorhizobium alkalisoli]